MTINSDTTGIAINTSPHNHDQNVRLRSAIAAPRPSPLLPRRSRPAPSRLTTSLFLACSSSHHLLAQVRGRPARGGTSQGRSQAEVQRSAVSGACDLLERPGEVVTCEQLQIRRWPDPFVDVERNLNTAVNKIREVLGGSAETPRYVETLSRRGYRCIGELERAVEPVIAVVTVEPDPSGTSITGSVATTTDEGVPRIVGNVRWAWVPATLFAVVVLLAGAYWYLRRPPQPSGAASYPQRFTLSLRLPENGTLSWNAPPAISLDARSIAFGAVVDGVARIWVHDLESGAAHSLPDTEGATVLAWSPDGHAIVFADRGSKLKRIEIAGGPARPVSPTHRENYYFCETAHWWPSPLIQSVWRSLVRRFR